MATQSQTQEVVEREQPRHRRRTKERPDALVNQLSKLSETDSSTQQKNTKSNAVVSDTRASSILQEAAQAFLRLDRAICGYLLEASRKLDHKEFKLQSLAQSHGLLTVSEWAKSIESRVTTMNLACVDIMEYPETYLRSISNAIYWAEAEVIFNQSMNRTRYDPNSGPVNVGSELIQNLILYSNRYTVLIADLLPELVELKLFDLQMQAALRGKWIILDSIMERTVNCSVPRWHEISKLFKPITAKEDDQLPARLNQISSALWLSLLVFLITIPTTALGWQYSPHQPGTTQDADFWFLIQSSCMTILGFAVLAIPIWRSEAFSVKARFWVWGLLIAASLCMALAPVVYVFGPTEWSQCMSIISGIFQVFLTLQVALVADSAGKGGGKSGKMNK